MDIQPIGTAGLQLPGWCCTIGSGCRGLDVPALPPECRESAQHFWEMAFRWHTGLTFAEQGHSPQSSQWLSSYVSMCLEDPGCH